MPCGLHIHKMRVKPYGKPGGWSMFEWVWLEQYGTGECGCCDICCCDRLLTSLVVVMAV